MTPILFFLPADTIESGRHVCNDILGHALVAKGAHYYEASGLDTRLFKWYPRGFHSVLQYISAALGVSPITIILPFLLFCYSFVVPFSWDVSKEFKINRRWNVIGLSLLICSPFLSLAMLYLGFAAQSTVVPILLTILFRIFIPNQITFERQVLLQLFLIGAAIATYTVFPLTCIGLGFCIFAATHFKEFNRVFGNIKLLLKRKIIIELTCILLVAFPGISGMFLLIAKQFAGDERATDVLHSPGNLKGYLSPLHFAGFWSPQADFRFSLDSTFSWLPYAQSIMLIAFLGIIFGSQIARRCRSLLVTLLIPVFLIPMLGATEYIHFKYFSVALPFTFLIVGISLADLNTIKDKIIFTGVIGLMFGLGVIYSGRVIGKWPVVSKTDYEQYLGYRKKFLLPGSVLVLTQDDWFRYVSDKKNIFIPLIGLLPTYYKGETVNRIIVDRDYSAANSMVTDNYPKIKEAIQNPKCLEYSDKRIEVYKAACMH